MGGASVAEYSSHKLEKWVSRYTCSLKTWWNAFFNWYIAAKFNFNIYIFIQKHNGLNERNLDGHYQEHFMQVYESKNHTLDAFLSQTSFTHANSYLSITSVWIEREE